MVLFLSSTYWAMGQPNESNEHNRDLIESSEQDRIELMELKRREREIRQRLFPSLTPPASFLHRPAHQFRWSEA